MFVNCSNHASVNWSERQRRAALEWGEIVDYPFPNVSAYASEDEIRELALKVTEEIVEMRPEAVMCQGEFTLSYAIITELKRRQILVVSACSQRNVKETILEDGNSRKESVFEFVRFRKY